MNSDKFLFAFTPQRLPFALSVSKGEPFLLRQARHAPERQGCPLQEPSPLGDAT